MNESSCLTARTGLYFEEYRTGDCGETHGRTITEADVVAFAALTGDWNPIHTDVEYAAQHPFGQRVAHGILVVSITSALMTRTGLLDDTLLAFREISDWKFSRPIRIGDTIHARFTIGETRPVPRLGGGMVALNIEVLNQRGEIVQKGRWSVLVKSSPTPQS